MTIFLHIKNEGKHTLSKADINEISRYILFLKSDLEYQWPSFLQNTPVLRLLISVLTFGVLPSYVDSLYLKKGSTEIWPFFSYKDYKEQLSNPKYMNKNT